MKFHLVGKLTRRRWGSIFYDDKMKWAPAILIISCVSFVTFESFQVLLWRCLRCWSYCCWRWCWWLWLRCAPVLVQTATFLTFIRLKRSDTRSASLNHPRMLQRLGTGSLRWDLELFNKLSNFRGRQNFPIFFTMVKQFGPIQIKYPLIKPFYLFLFHPRTF